MTLDEAIEYSNSKKTETCEFWKLKKILPEEEFEKLLSEKNKKEKEYREEFIFKGKHITETSNIFKNIIENFSYNDYEMLDKLLSEHLDCTKYDVFLLESSYEILKFDDFTTIIVYSKFKNYPKHFEHSLTIHKNV